jgi:transmembrane sensor
MMAPRDLDKLITKYLAGKCTEEEADFINSWYSALGQSADPAALRITEDRIASTEDRILKNLRVHTDVPADEPLLHEKEPGTFWSYAGIAASILFCLGMGYYFFPAEKPFTSPISTDIAAIETFTSIGNHSGAAKRVILPDGSIVQMSPESRIRFAKHVEGPSRELFLEGEAYFDVAHNSERPFFVYAGDVVTKVLGTSFIVRARDADEQVTVSVKTGKVTVYPRNAAHKKTVLVRNQEAVYDAVREVVDTQPVPVVFSEHTDNIMEMHFDETPVAEVLSMLKETYDIDIIFQDEALSGCVLTSSFYEEGLYDRIDVICTAIGATYRIVDAQILVESQGCNLKTE